MKNQKVVFYKCQTKDGLAKQNHFQELSPAANQDLLRLARITCERFCYPRDSEPAQELLERCRQARKQKKPKIPQVGIFFIVDDRPLLVSIPWNQNPSFAGYRTFGVSHSEFWEALKRAREVPENMYYLSVPRGRVSYPGASRRFTVYADACIINDQPQLRGLMELFYLPSGTTVLADAHFTCHKCPEQVRRDTSGFRFLDCSWWWMINFLRTVRFH